MNRKIMIAIVVLALLGGLIYYNEYRTSKKDTTHFFNESIGYSTKNYNPYNTKIFFDQCKKNASNGFKINEDAFDNKKAMFAGKNNLMIVASPNFLPTSAEVKEMLQFIENGNSVFISSFSMNSSLLEIALGGELEESNLNQDNYPPMLQQDSLKIYCEVKDSSNIGAYFTYPGYATMPLIYETQYLQKVKNLAYDHYGNGMLLDIQYGEGHIYILQSPLAISNYFLAHKQNYQFFNFIAQQIELKKRKVVWDTFYKRFNYQRPEPSPNNEVGESYFLKVISQYPPLQWAIFTFFLGIILFILVYSKRIQLPVRVLPEIKNNSIPFIKAVSGLYWLKQDHKIIAEKIILQFYEYLYSSYRIHPKDITINNAEKMAQKMNVEVNQLEAFLKDIEKIEQANEIEKRSLINLYIKYYKITQS